MQLVDTHSHIYLPEFDTDREAVLKRATETGITHIMMPAIDSATHAQMLSVEAAWPLCKAMMGLHPCSVNDTFRNEMAIVEAYLNQQKFIAVGEIGLDFYWDTSFRQQQYEVFETQIRWALQHDLPIVIHSRNALDECIEAVRNYPNLRGVFHCFSGTVEQARQIIDLSFYLGIGGVLTYKKAGLDAVLKEVGLERVVLETDAPYLTPVPHRGKRNESGYLSFITAKLAEVSGFTVEEVATITTQNAATLFRLT